MARALAKYSGHVEGVAERPPHTGGGLCEVQFSLPLDYLAWGDSNSLLGSVHAWSDRNGDLVTQVAEIGAVVAPVGPCCAGGQPNTIAPNLRPPYTNEFLLGVHTRIGSRFMLRLGSTDRRHTT